jgi:phosphoglycerate dehydrogenase-like enzyme
MKKMLLLKKSDAYLDAIRSAAPGWEIVTASNFEAAKHHIAQAEILLGYREDLAQACISSPALRWIQVWSAGVEALPLDEMKRKGIFLTKASGVHGQPLSESLFAMALAFARGLRAAIEDQTHAHWNEKRHAPTEIHGKTLGILGVGAIGQEAARIGKAFGMRVLGLRRSAEKTPYVDAVYPAGEIDALLPQCDYVMNVLPYTAETHHIMNADRFALMKPESCYISAGRGKTTDQQALIHALRQGIIGCAGLDVTDPEPLSADSPLWAMPNVIITPHIAGRTDLYSQRAFDIFLENLKAYVATGKPVRNVVDYDLNY